MTTPLAQLPIKLFADGADRQQILALHAHPHIRGFTTNPTLMKQAGITDYRAFCRDILRTVTDKPVSIEVFADDLPEMHRQALEIASWGANVFVKIPICNTRGVSTADLITRLSAERIPINVTALMTLAQVRLVTSALALGAPAFVSVFAGRIADTGRDPVPLMAEALAILRDRPDCELIWASPREVLNIFQASAIGCHAITATQDILRKLDLVGKDLAQYSLETVRMFHNDALAAGFTL
jgi:transaldolase